MSELHKQWEVEVDITTRYVYAIMADSAEEAHAKFEDGDHEFERMVGEEAYHVLSIHPIPQDEEF